VISPAQQPRVDSEADQTPISIGAPSSNDAASWDEYWPRHAEAARANPAQQYRRHLVRKLLDVPGDAAGVRILDIGSGLGCQLVDLQHSYTGVAFMGLELSGSAIEIAQRRMPDARFLKRDLLHAGEPPDQFKGWATHAICEDVLEHVDDPLLLLRNATAYMHPGCRLVVTVPGGPMSAFDRYIGHRRHYSTKSLHAVLERAGFEVERVSGAGFPMFNLYRLVVILRGRRLIADTAGGAGPLARLVMATFGLLFRLNLDSGSWGWQITAKCRVPGL
jgi:SAM-dependent methyltransferase